jgi:hypothetical protein
MYSLNQSPASVTLQSLVGASDGAASSVECPGMGLPAGSPPSSAALPVAIASVNAQPNKIVNVRFTSFLQ